MPSTSHVNKGPFVFRRRLSHMSFREILPKGQGGSMSEIESRGK